MDTRGQLFAAIAEYEHYYGVGLDLVDYLCNHRDIMGFKSLAKCLEKDICKALQAAQEGRP